MGRQDILLPSRFLFTVGHLVVIILAFYAKETNVLAGLAIDANKTTYTNAENSLLAALAISIICFGVDFFGLVSGGTGFISSLSVIHSVLHFFGGVLTAWYIVDHWGYLSMWPIVIFFNLVPTILESFVLCTKRQISR